MAVTKKPVLNLVVALLVALTVISLCIPCWSFEVLDAQDIVLRDGKLYLANASGEPVTDADNNLYILPKRINGTAVKADEGIIIYSNKTPVGDLEGQFEYTLEGATMTLNGKNVKVGDNGVLTVDGKPYTTEVVAPPFRDPNTGKTSAPVQVDGDMYVNYNGVIVTSKNKAYPVPVLRTEAISIMSYIALPHHRAGKLVTVMFEGIHEGFILNGQVWFPIILFLLGIVAVYVVLVLKRNTTNGLILPIVFSIVGILIVWTNQLTRGGGLATTLVPTILMAGVIAVAAYNGNWFDVEGDWRRDPSAAGKIKEIKAAVGKKNLELLKSYVQSSDPSVRIAALDGIARIGGFNAFHPIVGQLSSSNADVRIAAAEALVTLGDPRGRTYLMYYMEEDPSPEVREAMNAALGKMPSIGA